MSLDQKQLFLRLFRTTTQTSSNETTGDLTYLPPWLQDETLPLLNQSGVEFIVQILSAGVNFRQAINEVAEVKRHDKQLAEEKHDEILEKLYQLCEDSIEADDFHSFVINTKAYREEVERFRSFVSALETSLSFDSQTHDAKQQEEKEEEDPLKQKIEKARNHFNDLCNELSQNNCEKWNSFLLNTSSQQQCRPPWQLTYAAENDPFAPPSSDESKVTFDGGKIIDKYGRDVWEDRCYGLGITIQSGVTIGVGVKRFRSVSRSHCVRSCIWHEWMRKWLSRSYIRNKERIVHQDPMDEHRRVYGVEFHVCENDEEKSFILDPYLHDVFVECYNHRVMAFSNICDSYVDNLEITPRHDLQLQTAILESLKEYKNFPLIYHPINRGSSGKSYDGISNWWTFQQVEHLCVEFLQHLIASKMNQHDPASRRLRCVAAVLKDIPEWFIADIACTACGICFVGLHTNWPEEDLHHALDLVKPDVVLVHEENRRNFDETCNKGYSLLSLEKDFYCISNIAFTPSTNLNTIREGILSPQSKFFSFLQEEPLSTNFHFHIEPMNKKEPPLPQRPFTLMFSSGTSGKLKAVEVSCDSWISTTFKQQKYALDPYSIVSFNALAHGLDRGLCWSALFSAGRITFLSTVLNRVAIESSVREEKMKILNEVQSLISSQSTTQSSLPSSTLAAHLPDFVLGTTSKQYSNPSVIVASPDNWSSLKMLLCDELELDLLEKEHDVGNIRKIIQVLFGDNLKQAATGGAPVSESVVRYFQKLFSFVETDTDVSPELKQRANEKTQQEGGVGRFHDVYGATEAPGISTNHEIRGVLEIALKEVSGYDLFSSQNTAFGELLVRGNGVARKYHRDEESSQEAFLEGGWYRSGDVVRLELNDRNNDFKIEQCFTTLQLKPQEITLHMLNLAFRSSMKLFIVDRVRDLIELYVDHQSVWVPASKVENIILQRGNKDFRFSIEQVAVFGDRMLPFLVAVVGIHLKNQQEVSTEDILKNVQDSFKSEQNPVPSYWIPKKILVRCVVMDSNDAKDATKFPKIHKWDSGGEFRTHIGKLRRGILGKAFRNDLEKLLV